MEQKALRILRRNLDAFIKADPVDVIFTRPTQVQNVSTGGWIKGTPVTLPPQQFRFVPFKRRLSDQTQNTQDGPLRLGDYIIIGKYSVDVEIGDEFGYNARNYRVKDIEPKTDDRSLTDRVTVSLEVRD